MAEINVKDFQRVLEAKKKELLAGGSDREEILIENAAEDFDRLQQQMNREVAIRNLDRESKLLKDVQRALNRIEQGTFGVCLRCEEDIPEKRLKALPWAAYCVSCQEAVDRLRAAGESVDDDHPEMSSELAAA
ncbi:MAG TPA: TraR/DksA family transcriptional regulator [Bryobacteraceae bacterium]|nr:TraR/DksA family transcriptional regulator [Bryobacteraceae bacterium]